MSMNYPQDADYPYTSWEYTYKKSKLWELPWDQPNVHPKLAEILNRQVASLYNKALDLGCGTGVTSRYLASLGFQVDAWDISETAIKRAKQLSESYGYQINYHQGNLLRSAFTKKQYYSLILDWLFLHDVQDNDIKNYFSGICNSLKKGGTYVLGVFKHSTPGFKRPSYFSDCVIRYWTIGEIQDYLKELVLIEQSEGYVGSEDHYYLAGFYSFEHRERKNV